MKKVRKVIIPVAGLGTRFLPATKALPKEILPIIDKPTIQYIVEEAVASGIEMIIFITSPYKKAIEDHFDVSYELEHRLEVSNKLEQLDMIKKLSKMVQICYVRQGEPLGSGHAVNQARELIGDEPFAVMYGDDLMDYGDGTPVLKQLIDVYEKYDCNVIGVQEVDPNTVNRYGMIKYSDESTGKIDTIVEKPKIGEAPSLNAGLGRYIVKPEIFGILENLKQGHGNEYQFTDAMKELMKNQPFYACKFDGKYHDVGSKLGYIIATLDFALQRDDLKEGLLEYIDKITG